MHGRKSEGRAEGSVFAGKEFRFCCCRCLQAEIPEKSWVFRVEPFRLLGNARDGSCKNREREDASFVRLSQFVTSSFEVRQELEPSEHRYVDRLRCLVDCN